MWRGASLRRAPGSHAPIAWGPGPRCYTTARYDAGRLRHGAHSARRLARDAEALGLGGLDEAACARALRAAGEAAFGGGPGVVRLEAGRDAGGQLTLAGTTRPLGPCAATWRVGTSGPVHPGPLGAPGVKRADLDWLDAARAERTTLGLDELLLFDAEGRLVEGTRTTPIWVDAAGTPATPPLGRGGVAGVAREILFERVPELRERDATRDGLRGARELVLVNAVRGACAAASLDGAERPVAPRGSWWERLAAALDADADGR